MFRAGVLLEFRRRHRGGWLKSTGSCFDKTRNADAARNSMSSIRASIPPDVFELAGRLALASHHPVAAAVARAVERAKSPLAGAVEEPGQDGSRGQSMVVEVRLGRPSLLRRRWAGQ